jgi:hypothetical protein
MTIGSIAIAALLAGCSRSGGDAAPSSGALASRDCTRTQGDSARAVCLAENEIERIGNVPAEAYAVERRGDTLCVHTWPDHKRYPVTLDGEGAVEVVAGKVIATLTGDSVPCPGDAARVQREHWGGRTP